MKRTKRKKLPTDLESFRDTGLISKIEVIDNQDELHPLTKHVIVYAGDFYIQMLSDGHYYYSNQFNRYIPNERRITSNNLEEVEEVVWDDFQTLSILSSVSSKTQS